MQIGLLPLEEGDLQMLIGVKIRAHQIKFYRIEY